MSRRKGIAWIGWGSALALVVSLAACDNTVSPLNDDPERFFAVHGFLDMAADTQFVRVEALRSTILNQSLPTLDATVTSNEEASGTTSTWRDSLITLNDGTRGHLFFGLFRPVAGATYHLDVRRDDGKTTRATTRIPPVPALRPDAPQGSAGFLFQPVTLARIDQPVQDAEVRYRVTSLLTGTTNTLSFSYGSPGKTNTEGWGIDIFLARDGRNILRKFRFDNPADTTLALRDVSLTFGLPSDEWQTPDTSPNIENGVGFFGSVGRYAVAWHLDSTVVETLGFEDRQGP